MKLQEVRFGIRRLCRLLSTTSGAGGIGGSSTHGARQVYSESLSIEDDSPPDPPFCSRKGSDVTDRLPLSSFRALIASPSSVSLGNFWAHSSLCYASSSAHVFHTTFRFSGATFESSREKLVEVGYFPSSDGDEEEEVRGQHEELRKQRSPETPATNISQQNGLQGQLGDLKLSTSKDSIGSREPGTDGGTNNTATGKVPDELGWRELGWTRENVLNWPNTISMARLVSGPILAWMILQELWGPAFLGLVAAGISDWVDGYVARRMNINSVLGSYLDPMADKFLIGSVAVAMTYTGLLHPALVGLIIARDGGLMGGAFLYRAYSLGWKWKDWRDIFKVNIGGAGKVEPLFISKNCSRMHIIQTLLSSEHWEEETIAGRVILLVNTVLQLALVAVALLQPALSVQDTWALVPLLSWSVVGTTSLSGIAYIYTYLKNPGSLAVLQQGAHVRGSQAS